MAMKPSPGEIVSAAETAAWRSTYWVWQGVADYRLYGLDGVDKVASAAWIEAEDDQTAIEVAKEQMDGHDVELWQGRRLIARIPRKRPA